MQYGRYLIGLFLRLVYWKLFQIRVIVFNETECDFFRYSSGKTFGRKEKKKETKDTVFVHKINEFFLLKSLNKEFFWPFFMMIHSFIVKTFCENVLFTKDYLSQNLDFL